MNRRQFIQQAGAVSALGFPAILRSASPNSMLQVASVGVARMGGNTMRSVASHPKVKIVALCDVDARYIAQAAKDFPDAKQIKDWRDLLAKHADQFDAVTVGTPDHMHAPIACTAMRAKKHVYLQKPMAPTPHECRVLAQEAAKAGVVTQLGNQGRSSIESRMMVELLRTKAIGRIKEVIMWENKKLNWWPKNTELRPQGDAIPEGLDWDHWIGVRTPRPYLNDTYHPQNWRAWFDFGCGELGDMGCHHLDSTFDGLKLRAPTRVRQIGEGSTGPLWAAKRHVEFEFPGNELIAGETLKLTWLDGGTEPDRSVVTLPSALKNFPANGGFWIGEHGAIFKPYAVRPFVMPEADFPAEKYPRGFGKQDHYHNWVDAILAGRKSCADFSHGGPLTETVVVGTIADRFPGQWLEWDRAGLKFTNHEGATALVKREYRDGWKIEGLG
ncbi:Gfo/Idh/MocA family oxidoreductase [Prosthecobacter sp.]|uniref:Gfo/Idh/MocA family protein n=1 Tax=Prosthecobacter sp. TaxID=1965333 RepID=UPI001D2395FF|nr:Gfo/Idh/MocA family oxidoreductase [Prosthecobacter sp.]MCB1277556.1 Gfo/Idh/MocA family oxidoreductase [Prosthecobacter sp.]